MSAKDLETAFRDLAHDLFKDLAVAVWNTNAGLPHGIPEDRIQAHAAEFRELSARYFGPPIHPPRRRSWLRRLFSKGTP